MTEQVKPTAAQIMAARKLWLDSGSTGQLVEDIAALIAERDAARAAVDVAEAAEVMREARRRFHAGVNSSNEPWQNTEQNVVATQQAYDAALARYRAAKGAEAAKNVNGDANGKSEIG